MARQFNGSSDKITYSHISGFDGIDKLTIGAWVYSGTGGASYAGFLGQLGAASGAGNTHGFGLNNVDLDETHRFIAFRNASSTPQAQGTAGDVTAGSWHFEYVLYDGTQGTNANRVRHWVGTSEKSLTHSGTHPTTIGTTDQPFTLGTTEGTLWFDGRLAEIGIWLDADESRIADLASGKAPSFYLTNLHVYLPLLEAGGADDSQGNAGSPTITGTTAVAHPPGITYPGGGGTPPYASIPKQMGVRRIA